MDPTTPDAQGTVAADPQNTQQNAQSPGPDGQQNAGIQKRIDELTARFHEAQGIASKKDETIMELTARLAELASQRANPTLPNTEPELPEGLDPSTAKFFQRQMEAMEKRMQSTLQQFGATVASSEAQRTAGKYAQMVGDQSGWIEARAAQLASQWRGRGLELHPDDAGRFAMAEFIEKRPPANRDAAGRFQPPLAPMTPPNPQQNFSPPTARQPLPDNFADLPPQTQEKLLRERGLEDLPL